MSLADPKENRLGQAFPIVEAIAVDLTGGYQQFNVAGLGQPTTAGAAGQLVGKEQLQITVSAAPGTVSVATLEAQNWPDICIEYISWYLGDVFSFGNVLTYVQPANATKAANRDAVFTLTSYGLLRRTSLGGDLVFDLNKCGATKFYITLRSMTGQPGTFKVAKI
jgi:hypothetical protein